MEMKKSTGGVSGRASIIRSVQTPLGFLSLLVLVVEVILGGLAIRATGTDFTILVAGMLAILFASLVAVLVIARRSSATPFAVPARTPDRPARKYDVFLSSVLAGFADDSRLREEKQTALAIERCLVECGFSVYYAGKNVKSRADFDTSHLGAKQDISALKDSRYFILLYPERHIERTL
jgi:hypothetical protein